MKKSKKATELDLQLQQAHKEIVVEAEGFIIDSDAKQQDAQLVIKNIKEMKERITAFYEEERESAYNTYQIILNKRKSFLDPLDEADKILRQRSSAYYQKQEEGRKRKEAEEFAKAQKKAEDEKLEQAAELEKADRKEEAEALLNTPTVACPDVSDIPPAPVSQKGVSYRANWKWRIIDENKVPRKYLMLNEKMINRIVKDLKQNHGIPGIQVYDAGGMSVRNSD
jgi:hypothetical protein